MVVKKLAVSEEEKAILEKGSRSRSNLRLKERSQTLLWLHEGLSVTEIARRQGIRRAAVYGRRYRFEASGLSSLQDAPRSGPPRKLNEEMLVYLKRLASTEALNARELLSRLQQEFGVEVHVNTIKRACHWLGLVYKRTRHSLKKKRTGTL